MKYLVLPFILSLCSVNSFAQGCTFSAEICATKVASIDKLCVGHTLDDAGLARKNYAIAIRRGQDFEVFVVGQRSLSNNNDLFVSTCNYDNQEVTGTPGSVLETRSYPGGILTRLQGTSPMGIQFDGSDFKSVVLPPL